MAGWESEGLLPPMEGPEQVLPIPVLPKALEGAAESNFQLSVLKIGGWF